MQLSLVSSVFNESENILAFLQLAMSVQKHCQLEIPLIVVDNCSTDDSFNVLAKNGKHLEELILLQNTKAAGYGYGINKALGEVKTNYAMVIPSNLQFDVVDCIRLLDFFVRVTNNGEILHQNIFTTRKSRADGFYNRLRGAVWREIIFWLIKIPRELDPASQLKVVCIDCLPKTIKCSDFLWDIENTLQVLKISGDWKVFPVGFNRRIFGKSSNKKLFFCTEVQTFFRLLKFKKSMFK